ncbi:GNAT family N-acetyltransferase [Sphingobium sp.]|uniref:GNAT family N-acetyltransferase n=1 Tax=Sphingobium sp. TaxID=1912891 RepID=UPI002CD8C647|nr:GNAT family N-acetyltransferase [Sphingobium sp.]HUD92584.1 GNAT family N-acetyltransferase [Sphingobium sp.]
MPEETIDQKLRQMAEHRGFKLVKSRKRKAGIGDFGKFGLTQADGKPLLGMGEDGLTASAEDVEAYLRKGSLSTWKASAESVPARAALSKRRKLQAKSDDDDDDAPVIRPRARNAANQSADARKAVPENRNAHPAKKRKPAERAGKASTGRRSASPKAEPSARAVVEPPPTQVPQLRVRPATSADATALAKLLRQLDHADIAELGIARNLEAVRKAKGGTVVAELGTVVGCCTWAVVPTVQYGLMGRITIILVDEDHRRRGIATALFEAASASLSKAGCTRVEAMSDIEIRNAHGFFRALKFEQTSYRFARAIEVGS